MKLSKNHKERSENFNQKSKKIFHKILINIPTTFTQQYCREALRRFGQKNVGLCDFSGGPEDVSFGKCMEKLGVAFGDTLDALGRTRFHCYVPEIHILGKYNKWYDQYDKYKGTKTVS